MRVLKRTERTKRDAAGLWGSAGGSGKRPGRRPQSGTATKKRRYANLAASTRSGNPELRGWQRTSSARVRRGGCASSSLARPPAVRARAWLGGVAHGRKRVPTRPRRALRRDVRPTARAPGKSPFLAGPCGKSRLRPAVEKGLARSVAVASSARYKLCRCFERWIRKSLLLLPGFSSLPNFGSGRSEQGRPDRDPLVWFSLLARTPRGEFAHSQLAPLSTQWTWFAQGTSAR